MSIRNIISITTIIMLLIVNKSLSQEKFWYEEVNAIIIEDENEFHVLNGNKAKYKHHRIVQINNDAGKKYSHITLNENKFVKIKNISGRILDKNGNLMRKLQKDEIKKGSYSAGYQLYSDSKYQKFDLVLNSFPYLVEYEYEEEYSSLFFWPDWYPQKDVPVLKSSYKLILKEGIEYQTHTIGIEIEPTLLKKKGESISIWELEKIEPKIEERIMPPENELQMALLFTPKQFELENYTGSFNTWDDFALWYRKLTSAMYNLPQEAREQVQQIVKGIEDDQQKAQKLYTFLQDYTRYVSINLGIGGWQPYSAELVYRNRYGDCKDLSTFMMAMLKEVGISAYPALVRTRDNGVLIKEFPSNQFTHVITVVPFQNDTLWLECTADLLPAGELPFNVEGCNVLAVKQNGCDIVQTPKSSSGDNLWKSKIEGRLTSFGACYFTGEITATGNQSIYLRNNLYYRKLEERKRWLVQLIGKYLPKLDLTKYEIDYLDQNIEKPITIRFEGSSDKFGVRSATRLFINPNMLNRETADDVPREEERKFPIYYRYAYMDIDSLIIKLPENFRLETAPESEEIKKAFGSYMTSYSITDGKLIYCRTFKCEQNEIPRTIYEDYLDFMKTIVKKDKSQFVLAKVK